MNPLFYSLIGSFAGAGIVALVFALARRGRKDDAELIQRLEHKRSAANALRPGDSWKDQYE